MVCGIRREEISPGTYWQEARLIKAWKQEKGEGWMAFPFLQIEIPELRSLLRLPYLSFGSSAVWYSSVRLYFRFTVLYRFAVPSGGAVRRRREKPADFIGL